MNKLIFIALVALGLASGAAFFLLQRQDPVYYAGAHTGMDSPRELFAAFQRAVAAQDRAKFLSLCAWGEQWQAEQTRAFFLNREAFEAYTRQDEYAREQLREVSVDEAFANVKQFERGMVWSAQEVLRLLEANAVSFEINGDLAGATFTLSYGEEAVDMLLEMRRIDGEWYIWNHGCAHYLPAPEDRKPAKDAAQELPK